MSFCQALPIVKKKKKKWWTKQFQQQHVAHCTLWTNQRMVMNLYACWCWMPHTVPSKCSFMNHSCSVCLSQRYDFCVFNFELLCGFSFCVVRPNEPKKKLERREINRKDVTAVFNVQCSFRVTSFNFPLVEMKCFWNVNQSENQDTEALDYNKLIFNIGSWLIQFVYSLFVIQWIIPPFPTPNSLFKFWQMT